MAYKHRYPTSAIDRGGITLKEGHKIVREVKRQSKELEQIYFLRMVFISFLAALLIFLIALHFGG